MENSMVVLKKLKTELPHDPAIPILGIYPKAMKAGSWTVICTLMITAAWFTTAKMREQLKCPSTDGWINKTRCIHTMEYYSAFKGRKFWHMLQHGEPWTHYAEWELHLHEVPLEQSNSQRKQVEGWLPEAGGRENGELLFPRHRVSAGEDEKFWRWRWWQLHNKVSEFNAVDS